MPPSHRGGIAYPRLKVRDHETVEVSNLFHVNSMFGEVDKKAQERLAKTLGTPLDETPRFSSLVGEEVFPIVADDVEVQVVQLCSRGGDAKNGQPVDSRRCWKKNVAEVPAKLAVIRRTPRCVESLDVDTLGKADVVLGVDNSLSESKSIFMDRSDVNQSSDALVFSPSRSSQAAGDIKVVTERNSVAEKALMQWLT